VRDSISQSGATRSVHVIPEHDSDPKRHLLVNTRHIPLGPFSESANRVVRNSELLAPETDGPARNTERSSDVFLENTFAFEASKKLTVWAPINASGDAVFLAPAADRSPTNGKRGRDY
jgi:hypothetical protein